MCVRRVLVASNSFMDLLMFNQMGFLSKCLRTNFATKRFLACMSPKSGKHEKSILLFEKRKLRYSYVSQLC